METKTHFKKLRNPNYIGSWDLINPDGSYNDKVVTIAGVKKEMVHDGKGGQSECMTVSFAECKPMVCNSTNAKQIAKLANTPFIEEWAGKQIILTVQKVKAFGEQHDAIRVSNKPVVKPTLELNTPTFDKARKAIETKSATVEQIKKKYILSAEVEAALLTNG
jgi:hypothetical protein